MTRVISLAGPWSCRLDPEHRGVAEKWQEGTKRQHGVCLPGTTHTNGIGPPYSVKQISNFTPVTEHVGPAWYWRDIELSEADCGQCVELTLERCCWETFVWLNGQPVGTRDSLVSPHVYDLGSAAKPGTNRLTVMVDNANLMNKSAYTAARMAEHEELVMVDRTETRLKCGGHHTMFLGFRWNGITGTMEVRVRPRVRISAPQVYPDVETKRAVVRCTVVSDLDAPTSAELTVSAAGLWEHSVARQASEAIEVQPGRYPLTVELALGDNTRLWDEHTPALYRLEAAIETIHGVDRHETEFGMRNLSRIGGQLAINGRPTFLRGYLEKFVHPLTGYPPTDTAYWLDILGVSKAHGLNHVRFHSCCPPEAAFAAADRLGLILHIELPGCSGSEPDDPTTLDYLQAEALRILDSFGNHPSFCMLTMGNEILCDEDERVAQERLMDRVARCREHDRRHWYCCTAQAYTGGRDDDYYVTAWPNGPTARQRHRGEPLRGFRWNGGDVVDDCRFNTRPPETASDYRDGIAGIDRPVITHEVGMWAVYPDIAESPRYNGVLKPFNLEIIREFMEAKGTIGLARDFVEASGRLSVLLYKEEVESALRTPGLAGFQLLGIHDHPPQGTSTIGFLTALRESKGLVTPAQYRQFCSETVPLARLTKRTFTRTETLTADVDVAHYGPADLPAASLAWRLRSETGNGCSEGTFAARDVPTGALTRVGAVSAALSGFSTPDKLRLEVYLPGTDVFNAWDCWVYPAPVTAEAEGVRWARRWTPELAGAVEAGRTAILELGREQIPHATRACFTTLLWNPIMKRKHRSQTMGILCDPSHPALSDFPTEAHTNWQWWDVLRPSLVLDLDTLSPRPEPMVRMIDSFIGNRCLGVLFEAKLGKGRLLVTSLDLSSDLDARHAARQLRQSLSNYAASTAFRPRGTITPNQMDKLIAAHQTEPAVPTREEIRARFDRPVAATPGTSP